MLAITVPLLAAFALSRYPAVAAISIAAVLGHTAISIAVAQTDRLELLAVAASVSTVLMLIGLLAVVFGHAAGRPLVTIVASLAPPAALAGVIFGAAFGVARVASGSLTDIALAAASAVAYTAIVRARLPEHWALVQRLVAPLAGLRAPARQPSPSR
jgi:hypothetical protein